MDEAIWLEMRTRLNWQHYYGLARQTNNKCIVAKDVFWKKDKFNISFDYGITRKACITDLSDHPSLGYGRGKEENTFQVKYSFHLSTCITKGIHKFLSISHLWANNFTVFSLYIWYHLTEWSSSLFPDRIHYKRGFYKVIGYPSVRPSLDMSLPRHVPPQTCHSPGEMERSTECVKRSLQVQGRKIT